MSYVFLPPRTDNFFPPGPPYLAGLRGLRGLGDYAGDLAAYQADLAKWKTESIGYQRALRVRDTQIKTIDANYNAALASYVADKAAWDKEYAAYLVAAKSWNANFEAKKAANTARAQTIAQAHGLNLSTGFYTSGACVTQAEHDAAARNCTTVKGLGYAGLGGSDIDCGVKKLPICDFGPFPSVRSQPKAPSKPTYPAAVPPLRPAPVAPVEPPPPTRVVKTLTPTPSAPQTPSSVPVVSLPSDPGPNEALTPEDSKQASMFRNGLILVAIATGGYLVYRTLKKPKAQA